MHSLFAATPAIVPCSSLSPLAYHRCPRCCRRRRGWWTRPTDRRRPPPLPFRRHAIFCCCAILLEGFCCRAVFCLGSQSLTPPLPSLSPTTPMMSPPVLSDVFLCRELNHAAGRHRCQPIIVATKPSSPPPLPILLSSLSCLLQPSFLAIAVAAAISCLRQTPSSSLVTLLIVVL